MKLENVNSKFCKNRSSLVKDCMNLLTGKWKLHIIGILLHTGKLRYTSLQRELEGIGPKMLSKELQDLEMNHIVSRTVLNTKPLTVEYDLTEFGRSLEPIINLVIKWGIVYKERLYGKKTILD